MIAQMLPAVDVVIASREEKGHAVRSPEGEIEEKLAMWSEASVRQRSPCTFPEKHSSTCTEKPHVSREISAVKKPACFEEEARVAKRSQCWKEAREPSGVKRRRNS